jgi:beta-galactosidase
MRTFMSVFFLSMATLTFASEGRERIRFDEGWKFQRGPLKGSEVDNGLLLEGWKAWTLGKDKPTDGSPTAPGFTPSGPGWRPIKNAEDAFDRKPGFAWFFLELPNSPGPKRLLHFVAVDDNATVWVNGKKLIHHEGWNDPFNVPLDEVWKEGGPNRVVVLVENLHAPGYIKEAVLLSPGRPEKVPAAADPSFDDRSWREVHLPHDFIVEGTFDPKGQDSHGFLPKDMGWYRKTFDLPASDKGRSLWIDFDGAFRDSRVWLNGKLLGRHSSGYTPFRYDITEAAIYGGRNTLTVHVDARKSEGWWYEGGGLYRHVWLNRSDPLRVKPWSLHVTAQPIHPGASLTVEATLLNQRDGTATGTLVTEILDPSGKKVLTLSQPFKVKAGQETVLSQKGSLPLAKLWDLKTPHLYRAATKVLVGGKAIDGTNVTFGIRSLKWDKDKGFFLNGKAVKLKGTCNHQDHAGVGIALPDRLFSFRIEKLLAMGSNAYRCAHHPHAEELLDACDRLGMLVIDENRRLGDTEDILKQVETMVLRDRNHPSVIAWSLCNEESLQGAKEGRRRGEAMKQVVKRYDKTRLVTAAMNYGYGGEGLSNVLEAQGFNYNIVQYDLYRKDHPEQPLYGSETASTVSTRGEYVTDKQKGYVSAYDVNHAPWSTTAEGAWRPVALRDYLAGAFVWTGFDYRGEPTPYQWPCINSHFGILDVCGFPKDNYWYYKAWWGEEEVLHLFPHWNWSKEPARQVDVWCHTNYDQVELFLNGKPIGWREVPRQGHAEFKVWYEPGKLTVKGYKKGVFAREVSVETTDRPSALRLEPYATELLADGEDVTPITVSIVDAKGQVVPDAGNLVTFKVEGPGRIAGVGNGDPSSHEPDKADRRSAFHGLCQVLTGTTHKSGTLVLTAESAGLKGAAVTLLSKTP